MRNSSTIKQSKESESEKKARGFNDGVKKCISFRQSHYVVRAIIKAQSGSKQIAWEEKFLVYEILYED
jgi:type IV secretory pathway VirB9-like protein